MKTRCRCVRSDSYPFYGGRGIKVCERWMDFVNFLADMGNRPEGCTLDRVDSKGDYEPGNCRWATIREQSLNRANVHTVEFKGEELTLSEISKKYGVPKTTVYRRWKQGVRDDALICRVNRNKGR
ncbi:MAG: hypothetical protein JKY81_02370 [Colwellia sp.]|nr:hypothetical protein [Colwellia sp.]